MTTINKIRDEIFDSKKKLNYMDAKKFILDYLTEGIYTGINKQSGPDSRFNLEHLVLASLFTRGRNESDEPFTDLHHMFTSYKDANSYRADYMITKLDEQDTNIYLVQDNAKLILFFSPNFNITNPKFNAITQSMNITDKQLPNENNKLSKKSLLEATYLPSI